MSKLELSGITVAYDNFTLSNISFACEGGETVALVGRNGAGKSTTIDSIMGMTSLRSGTVLCDGQPITRANEHLFKQKIGYVGAAQDYYPSARVSTFLKIISRFYPQWDAAVTARCLSTFNIGADKKLSQLSTGTKVKLSLTVALSHSAEFFLLDEPTSGLDPIVREQVLEILGRLTQERGAGILFSTHITQDVEKIASRVLFLVNGALKLDSSPAALKERFAKLRLDRSIPDTVRRKGIVLNDKYIILDQSNAPATALDPCQYAPLLIEDVLIYLEGGVHNASVD